MNLRALSRDETLNQYASDYLRARELFLAARDHGINTLIFGGKTVNFAEELIPAINETPKIAYFKSKKVFLHGMERRLMPGEGSAQALPATRPSNLCGVLKVKGKKTWCSLFLDSKTLCIYQKSAKQQFPDNMLYLENFILFLQQDADYDTPGVSFDIATADTKVWNFRVMKPSEYKGKQKHYGHRENYTTGAKQWIEALKGLTEDVRKREATDDSKTITQKVVSTPDGEKTASLRASIGEAGVPTSGWLEKRGGEKKAFKKRFFTFDPMKKTLSWYAKEMDLNPRGSIFMGRYSLKSGDYYGVEKTNTELKFQVLTPARSLFLKAASIQERDKWIGVFMKRIKPVEVSSVFREQATALKETHQIFKSMPNLSLKDSGMVGSSNSDSSISNSDSTSRSSLWRRSIRPSLIDVTSGSPLLNRKGSAPSLASSSSSSDSISSFGDGFNSDRSESSNSPSPLSSSFTSSSLGLNSSATTALMKKTEESILMQHHTVAVIPVEERYIFTSPSESHLKDKAKKLHKKLQARFPNQRNVIVYNFNVRKDKRGVGIYHVGEMEIHRSLDCTATHLVHCHVRDEDVHNPGAVVNSATLYSLVKVS